MSKNILIVEDDDTYESILRRTIFSVDVNANILWKKSAEEAILEIEQSHAAGKKYDLIIVDIFLSGEHTGIELWKECYEKYADTPVIITSGMPVNRFFDAVGRKAIVPPFLCKPFYVGECRQIIQGLLVNQRSTPMRSGRRNFE